MDKENNRNSLGRWLCPVPMAYVSGSQPQFLILPAFPTVGLGAQESAFLTSAQRLLLPREGQPASPAASTAADEEMEAQRSDAGPTATEP